VNEEAGNEAPEVPVGRATISDRIAAFAMLDQMKDATQAQKCMRLFLVGFSASEIAGMLQTTVPTVHQNLYAERKKLKPSERSRGRPGSGQMRTLVSHAQQVASVRPKRGNPDRRPPNPGPALVRGRETTNWLPFGGPGRRTALLQHPFTRPAGGRDHDHTACLSRT
jgi:hypothetical protein